MYIRTFRDSIPNKDRIWPPESLEYKQLIEEYKKQGKLLDRILTVINDHDIESTWIWDSKETAVQWRNEPVQVARREEIKDYNTGVTISEEEI